MLMRRAMRIAGIGPEKCKVLLAVVLAVLNTIAPWMFNRKILLVLEEAKNDTDDAPRPLLTGSQMLCQYCMTA